MTHPGCCQAGRRCAQASRVCMAAWAMLPPVVVVLVGHNASPQALPSPGVEGWGKPRGVPSVGARPHPSPLDPPLGHGRPRADALRLLPGLGEGGRKGQTCGSTIRERALAGVCWWRHGCPCPWPWGHGCRRSATCSGLAHPLPAQTGLGGQPLERCQTEALRGVGGEALAPPVSACGSSLL